MNRRQKIAHLTSAHRAQDVRIYMKECRTLADAGYDIRAIGPTTDEELQSVAKGGSALTVPIERVPIPTSRIERMTKTVWQVFRAALRADADLYHFHDPELMSIALLLKARGKRVIYDVHENLPQDILVSKQYIPKVARRFVSCCAWAAESVAGSLFDGIVTVSDAFVSRFPSNKTCVIRNYPILREIPDESIHRQQEREPLLVWIGGLSRLRCANQLVDAMELVPASHRCRLAIAGPTDSAGLEAELAEKPGWEQVDYLGMIPHRAIPDLLLRARIGVAVNIVRPDYVDISTQKIYEYMLHGLPLVVSKIPSWERLVGEVGCGLVADTEHAEPLAEAITWLLDHPEEADAMAARGRQAVLSQFTWDREGEKLVQFYDRLLRPAA